MSKLDQSLVTDPRQVAVGEQVMVKLRTGQIRCLVEKGESHDG